MPKGENYVTKLDNQVTVIKNLLVCTNFVIWMVGASIFALSLWLLADTGLREWMTALDLYDFYIGLYILVVASLLMLSVSLLGIFAVLYENIQLIVVYIGTQALGWVVSLAGSAVLLDNSTQDSSIGNFIRESMRRLIMNSHHEKSRQMLAMLQENVGCCGADGPNDYLSLRQPLPTQCRDTVTGNTFFHGCVEELTWFFEEKAGWITGLAMTVCFMHEAGQTPMGCFVEGIMAQTVNWFCFDTPISRAFLVIPLLEGGLSVLNVVLSVILIQGVKKERDEPNSYRR